MDGEQLLRELLEEKNVASNSSWEHAIKLMESDERFESVRSLPNRKYIFNEYKQQKAKEEKEEQRLKAKKAKEDLEQFLAHEPRVNSAMRYRQACELFAELEVWRAVPSDDERRDILSDVMLEVKKREDEEASKFRKRNKDTLRDILDSIPEITAHTTWLKAQQILFQNEVYKNDPHLQIMDKLDSLEVFIEYVEQLEEEEKEERRRERKEKAKVERENRFEFVKLLDELHAEGKLTSISKWQNLYQNISADPRYLNLLSQPLSGSTALDLFKFYVEDLKARYEDENQIISEILRDRNFNMTLETTYVDFASFVSEDERSAKLDPGNLKMIFEHLFEDEREKEDRRLKLLLKEKRKLEHGLYSVLAKHLDVENDEDTLEWQTVRALICEEPAFKAIEKEEDRIEIFQNYLNSVNDTCLHHHKKPKHSNTASSTSCSHSHGHQHSYSVHSHSHNNSYIGTPSLPSGDASPPSSVDPNSLDLGELERKRRQIIEELHNASKR